MKLRPGSSPTSSANMVKRQRIRKRATLSRSCASCSAFASRASRSAMSRVTWPAPRRVQPQRVKPDLPQERPRAGIVQVGQWDAVIQRVGEGDVVAARAGELAIERQAVANVDHQQEGRPAAVSHLAGG